MTFKLQVSWGNVHNSIAALCTPYLTPLRHLTCFVSYTSIISDHVFDTTLLVYFYMCHFIFFFFSFNSSKNSKMAFLKRSSRNIKRLFFLLKVMLLSGSCCIQTSVICPYKRLARAARAAGETHNTLPHTLTCLSIQITIQTYTLSNQEL